MSEGTVSIRNKSGQSRFVPVLNRDIDADEVVEVPASLAAGLVCQDIWDEVKAKKAAEK